MEALSRTVGQWDVHPLLSKEQFQAAERVGIDHLHAQLLHNRGMKTL
ncbi:MAG: hypothetical protein JOZ18_10825, partial [Chloroflexi bacterium]|nr:hypothetical protein [Chloroflexota bacterium]